MSYICGSGVLHAQYAFTEVNIKVMEGALCGECVGLDFYKFSEVRLVT